MKRIVLFILAFSALLIADNSTVTLRGIGKESPIRKLLFEQADYISASDLFDALQARPRWNERDAKFEATLAGHNIVFLMGNIFCTVDGHPYNLVHAPRFHDDDLYLPVSQTLYLLSDILERVIYYDKRWNVISATGKNFNVVGASIQEKVNGDLIEIMLTRKMDYEVFISEGNWINVTIPGGFVDTLQFGLDRESQKIIGTRAFQFENAAQVSIQMRVNIAGFHTNYAPDPHRIQISLENPTFLRMTSDSNVTTRHDNVNPIDILVIDPGHGGEHDGAIGRNGLKEKEVTLDIALRLEDLLAKEKRIRTILTRRDDVTVGLEQRAMIANESQGDLFISIHANSSEEKNASGSEVYFLAAAKSDEARITELLENSDFDLDLPKSHLKNHDDLDYIVMDVLQTEYLAQSRELAEEVQGELRRNLGIQSRGINQAGFKVLNHVKMPSILVEVAFISNKIEERLLGQQDFRQSAAESIYAGILKFIERYEKEARANDGSQ